MLPRIGVETCNNAVGIMRFMIELFSSSNAKVNDNL